MKSSARALYSRFTKCSVARMRPLSRGRAGLNLVTAPQLPEDLSRPETPTCMWRLRQPTGWRRNSGCQCDYLDALACGQSCHLTVRPDTSLTSNLYTTVSCCALLPADGRLNLAHHAEILRQRRSMQVVRHQQVRQLSYRKHKTWQRRQAGFGIFRQAQDIPLPSTRISLREVRIRCSHDVGEVAAAGAQ